MNVIQKSDIDKVQDGLTSVINPTKKITDLEKKLSFSDTFENRVALADANLEAGIYDKAKSIYESALEGTFKDDYYVNTQLLKTNFYLNNFEEVISSGVVLSNNSKFDKSEASLFYALSLEKIGEIKKAENYLSKFDAPYSRYRERVELAKFYIRNSNTQAAKVILEDIKLESEGMSKTSYKQNKGYINIALELLNSQL